MSPKCSPEPCVKGLRYGKPLRTTDAYTYVNGRPPRRFDKFMMLAVAAALVALAAILYGYLRDAGSSSGATVYRTARAGRRNRGSG